MKYFLRRWACVGIGLLALLAASPIRAENAPGITVIGVGTAKGRPTVVEIAATISGDAELAADANVKFTDTKTKAIAALDALKIANLSIEFDGPSVSEAIDPAVQMRLMQGMGAGANLKPRVQVSEQLRLVLKDADKTPPDKLVATVMQILDACRDAGLQIGPPQAGNIYQMQIRAQNGSSDTLVTFKIPDAAALRDAAYQQAIVDAQAKAQRIAELVHLRLDGVISVDEQQYFQQPTPQQTDPAAVTGNASDKLAEIPVTVHLTVKFATAP